MHEERARLSTLGLPQNGDLHKQVGKQFAKALHTRVL